MRLFCFRGDIWNVKTPQLLEHPSTVQVFLDFKLESTLFPPNGDCPNGKTDFKLGSMRKGTMLSCTIAYAQLQVHKNKGKQCFLECSHTVQ